MLYEQVRIAGNILAAYGNVSVLSNVSIVTAAEYITGYHGRVAVQGITIGILSGTYLYIGATINISQITTTIDFVYVTYGKDTVTIGVYLLTGVVNLSVFVVFSYKCSTLANQSLNEFLLYLAILHVYVNMRVTNYQSVITATVD